MAAVLSSTLITLLASVHVPAFHANEGPISPSAKTEFIYDKLDCTLDVCAWTGCMCVHDELRS